MKKDLKSILNESVRGLDIQINKLSTKTSEVEREKLPYDIQRLLLEERKDAYNTIIKLMEKV